MEKNFDWRRLLGFKGGPPSLVNLPAMPGEKTVELLETRKRKRAAAVKAARQQRKGQRAYDRRTREQLARRVNEDMVARVAFGHVPEATPACRENAARGLFGKVPQRYIKSA